MIVKIPSNFRAKVVCGIKDTSFKESEDLALIDRNNDADNEKLTKTQMKNEPEELVLLTSSHAAVFLMHIITGS